MPKLMQENFEWKATRLQRLSEQTIIIKTDGWITRIVVGPGVLIRVDNRDLALVQIHSGGVDLISGAGHNLKGDIGDAFPGTERIDERYLLVLCPGSKAMRV